MLDEELFLRAITVTIDNWPSFQVAISNGMGGPNAAEKIAWLCSSLLELFKANPGDSVLADDVLEYLDDVMNNEFDTIIDDGSAEMVCTNICAYYRRISSGDKDWVLGKLSSLIEKQALLKQRQLEQQLQQQSQHQASTSVQQQGNWTVTAKQGPQNSSNDNSEDAEMSEPADDGWTVVRRKK